MPFDTIPHGKVAAVNERKYMENYEWRETIQSKHGWEKTGRDWYALSGENKTYNDHINGGLVIYKPKCHAVALKQLYDENISNYMKYHQDDQSILSSYLIDNDMIYWLDQRYNRVWGFWKELFYPNFDKLEDKVKRLYVENFTNLNYFCHFTSGKEIEFLPRCVISKKIGILIPSTSRGRNWTDWKETYLYTLTLKSFLLTYDQEHSYVFYIGIDRGDPVYDDPEIIAKIRRFMSVMKNTTIEFIYMDGLTKGHLTVMWNRLFDRALDDGCDYFFQCGDDIAFKTKGWVGACIDTLQQHDDIGLTGPVNNNFRILTQSFVSRKHKDMFGHYFPPEIINWCCDDWINGIYRGINHFFPLLEYECHNLGADPRYVINNDNTFRSDFEDNLKKLREDCHQIVIRDLQKLVGPRDASP